MNRLTRITAPLVAALVTVMATPALASAATTLASDTFSRSVVAGWAGADQGGTWSVVAGPSSALNVSAGVGTLDTPAGYSNVRVVKMSMPAARDVDATVKMSLPAMKGANASAYGALLLRRQSDGSAFRIGLWA